MLLPLYHADACSVPRFLPSELQDLRQRIEFVLEETLRDLDSLTFPSKAEQTEESLRGVAHRMLVIGECLVWDAEVLGGRLHRGGTPAEIADDMGLVTAADLLSAEVAP